LGKAIDTMNDNMKRLEARTVAAAEAALAARKVVTAIDVLQGIGWLPQARVDERRQGRLTYLEGAVTSDSDWVKFDVGVSSGEPGRTPSFDLCRAGPRGWPPAR
jgi:hypothetical protein